MKTDVQGKLAGPARQVLASLLKEAGLGAADVWQPLPGGANNQVYRVITSHHSALLKVYFSHPGDPRDRLGTEWSFCTFAWSHGLRCVPQPLACNRTAGMALYEFVIGERLRPVEITAEAVGQALDFYHTLNEFRDTAEAYALPAGSEACFSLAEHLACVERRLARLQTMAEDTPVAAEAAHFVRDDLARLWDEVRRNFHRQADKLALATDTSLPQSDRRLSPSDFGFHNALREADGRLRFFDFEYAGWDDPAKTVCDFFCQPALPAPMRYYESFGAQVAADLTNPQQQRQRFRLLLPVYRLKWCCILLNDFLPEGSARRRFASRQQAAPQQRETQLNKAQHLCQLVASGLHQHEEYEQ